MKPTDIPKKDGGKPTPKPEEPKTTAKVIEIPKLKPEEPKSTTKRIEESKPAPKVTDAPKHVHTKVEEPKTTTKKIEEAKSVSAKPEEPKQTTKKLEEPKPTPKPIEEPKAVSAKPEIQKESHKKHEELRHDHKLEHGKLEESEPETIKKDEAKILPSKPEEPKADITEKPKLPVPVVEAPKPVVEKSEVQKHVHKNTEEPKAVPELPKSASETPKAAIEKPKAAPETTKLPEASPKIAEKSDIIPKKPEEPKKAPETPKLAPTKPPSKKLEEPKTVSKKLEEPISKPSKPEEPKLEAGKAEEPQPEAPKPAKPESKVISHKTEGEVEQQKDELPQENDETTDDGIDSQENVEENAVQTDQTEATQTTRRPILTRSPRLPNLTTPPGTGAEALPGFNPNEPNKQFNPQNKHFLRPQRFLKLRTTREKAPPICVEFFDMKQGNTYLKSVCIVNRTMTHDEAYQVCKNEQMDLLTIQNVHHHQECRNRLTPIWEYGNSFWMNAVKVNGFWYYHHSENDFNKRMQYPGVVFYGPETGTCMRIMNFEGGPHPIALNAAECGLKLPFLCEYYTQ